MNVKCPKCQKVYLVNQEVVWKDWYEGCYEDKMIGECPNCKIKFMWFEKYRLDEVTDPTPY